MGLAWLAATLTALSATQGSGPVVLHYDWPEQGSVHVTEEVVKRGQDAVMTYTLRWTPSPNGSGIELEQAELDFVSVAGLDLSDPAVREGLQQVIDMTAAMPTFRIGSDGYVREVEGFGEMLDRLLGTIWADKPPEEKQNLRSMFANPQIQSTLEAKIAERWNHWVGNWIGVEVNRGENAVYEFDETTPSLASEVQVSFGDLVKHRGVECVEISTVSDADEDALMRTMLQMLGIVGESFGQELPEELPIAKVTRRETTHGIFAVDGLRPVEVTTKSVVRVWETGADAPEEQVEEHHYSFAWEDLQPEQVH